MPACVTRLSQQYSEDTSDVFVDLMDQSACANNVVVVGSSGDAQVQRFTDSTHQR